MAGHIWSRYLQDDTVIRLHVAFTDALPEEVLGGAVPIQVDTDVARVQSLLNQDVTSVDDAIATTNLNVQLGDDGVLEYRGLYGDRTYTGDRLTLTQANLKALGVDPGSAAGVDGYILFNTLQDSPYSWSTDYARINASSSDSLDLLSVILHELGHTLGFVSGVDSLEVGTGPDALTPLTLLDLYRYSAESLSQNAQEITPGEAAYFSIDGGQTAIAPFASGVVDVIGGIEGYQASHWANNALGQTPDGTGIVSVAQQSTDFLARLFAVSTPATSTDRVETLFDLLKDLNNDTSILDGEVSNVILDTQGGVSLGIMDPALAPGERSDISALDLQALNVLGYDVTSAYTPIDYGALWQEAAGAIATTLNISIADLVEADILTLQDVLAAELIQSRDIGPGVDRVQDLIDGAIIRLDDLTAEFGSVEQLIQAGIVNGSDLIRLDNVDTGSLERDRSQDVLNVIDTNADLYERRRKKRRRVTSSFWQEEGLDPLEVNIISDGAGETAALTVTPEQGADEFWVTTIEALAPSSDLKLRTVNLAGTNANDLLIPATDAYHQIDAGNGDNVVQLGRNGGSVTTGDRHDTILALNGPVTVDAGDGDNVVILNGTAGDKTVTTGNGLDYISVSAQNLQLDSGRGNDFVQVQQASNATLQLGEGDNSLTIQDAAWVSIYSGRGDDQIDVVAQYARLWITGGDNHIRIRDNPNITADSISDKTISVGYGDDYLDVQSNRAKLITRGGQDTIVLGNEFGAYHGDAGVEDYVRIEDFSDDDRLHLYGSASDYTLTTDQLLYQGDLIAVFSNGINFTLTGNQVSFVSATMPSPSQFSVAIPAIDDILDRVQTYHLTGGEQPIYRIAGGADAAAFRINSQTGDLWLDADANGLPIMDADDNGTYDVIVEAALANSTAARDQDRQRLSITIENGQLQATVDSSTAPSVPVESTPTVNTNGSTDANENEMTTDGPSSTGAALPLSVTPAGSISGQVRHDQDGDGDVTDADQGIPNVPISLFRDDNRDFKPDGDAIATTVTDSNGHYQFTEVNSGRYIVESTNLDGWTSTADVNGYNPDRIAGLWMPSTPTDLTNQDFLDMAPSSAPAIGSASIFGQVRNDEDGDGDLTDTDLGIPDVTITLFQDENRDFKPDGDAIATTVTDSNGIYQFTELVAGRYIVEETNALGWRSTADFNGYNPDRIAGIVLSSSQTLTQQDFLDTFN